MWYVRGDKMGILINRKMIKKNGKFLSSVK